MKSLQTAYEWRIAKGLARDTTAFRLFHGENEGTGKLKNITIDLYDHWVWVVEFETKGQARLTEGERQEIEKFLVQLPSEKKIAGGYWLIRPERGTAPPVQHWFGTRVKDFFQIQESGRTLWVRLSEGSQTGLFLDHRPLRNWLQANCKRLRVANLFAYTGSLSVAAVHGGASEVVTVDLSKPALDWAQKNLESNPSQSLNSFWKGDAREWLKLTAKKNLGFDLIIADPPSFSRADKDSFSTQKDLPDLTALILNALAPGGRFILSVNTEKLSVQDFKRAIENGHAKSNRKQESLRLLQEIAPDPTFPVKMVSKKILGSHLKGGIYQLGNET